MRLVSFCLLLGLGACAGPPQVSTGQSVTAEAHEVFITDWTDAKMAPVWYGRFDLDDYIDHGR